MSEKMDTQNGAKIVPAAADRIHGADRSGLGDEGWAEFSEDKIGAPDDAQSDVARPSQWEQPAQTMGSVRPAPDGKGIASSTDG